MKNASRDTIVVTMGTGDTVALTAEEVCIMKDLLDHATEHAITIPQMRKIMVCIEDICRYGEAVGAVTFADQEKDLPLANVEGPVN